MRHRSLQPLSFFSPRQNFSHPAVLALSSSQQSEQLLGSFLLDGSSYCVKVNIITVAWRNWGRHYRNYLSPEMLMVIHLFQFSRRLPQDVQTEDEERPGGLQQLHGPGGEDGVSGVRVPGGIIPSLADNSDRWEEQGLHFQDNRFSEVLLLILC